VIASQTASGVALMNTWYTCVDCAVMVVMPFPPVRS
jgi:hypothetical protein